MLTPDQRRAIDRSVLCWLATASADAQPGVSPKEIFTLHQDLILIANVASPNSMRNIKHNPKVCVAFLDIFLQKGVQVFGVAEVHTNASDRFAELAAPRFALAGEAFPFASLFAITPTAAKPILAPRYRLFPETTEPDQIASAMKTYGVRPAE